MIKIIRTDSSAKDFVDLVRSLDSELKERDGEDHAFYAQFNKIDSLQHVVLVYVDEVPISCGAFKPYDHKIVEVKRMFTTLDSRGRGIAALVLGELEKWAHELGFRRCILETGLKQPEAIRLYERSGYQRIPNYGQYAGVENSCCFEKQIP